MKIFILGPIPEDKEKYNTLYSIWENRLKDIGIDAISIHSLSLGARSLEDYPELLMEIAECRSVFILNNWKDAKLTRTLILWATELKMTIYYEEQYDILKYCFKGE